MRFLAFENEKPKPALQQKSPALSEFLRGKRNQLCLQGGHKVDSVLIKLLYLFIHRTNDLERSKYNWGEGIAPLPLADSTKINLDTNKLSI